MTVQELIQEVGKAPVEKRAITNLNVLNEAFAYARPSSFSRGMRIDLNGLVILLISGTASIDEQGNSIHTGDFRTQTRRTFQNITALLASEGATWKDIVRTTCYLRDIERDYAAFNEERTAFFAGRELGSVARINRNPGDPMPPGTASGDRGDCNVPPSLQRGVTPCNA